MSEIRRRAEEYLAIRRALGYKLVLQGYLLNQFVAYMEAAEADHLTTALAVAWAKQPVEGHPSWWGQRLTAVRGFARHLHAIDPTNEVPPADVLPAHFTRVVPYLYSEVEIHRLIQAAGALVPPLRAATYSTLIGLLAVTGMRVGEAIRLDHEDVDWEEGVIVVHASKFGRSRLVPLHPTTQDALRAYVSRRDRLCSRPSSTSFFVSARNARLVYVSVGQTFRRLLADAGIRRRAGVRPPRLHDLRHSFIVRTLLNWYRADVDVDAAIPRLSAYVGHVKPAGTYWYLEAAPELMTLAAQRLERAFGRRP